MFNPLKGLGDLNQLRKQAMQMQHILSGEEVVVDKNGVHIVMTGDQKIKEFSVDGNNEKRIGQAVEEALKQVQKIAAKVMMSMKGEM